VELTLRLPETLPETVKLVLRTPSCPAWLLGVWLLLCPRSGSSTAAHFAPILQSNEKAGALSRLCSRPMKKSRCGGSLDGVDFKVYQRRASSLTPKS
jgi:hypothetical protein